MKRTSYFHSIQDEEEIVRLYKTGKSYDDIEKIFGLGHTAVGKIIKGRGLTRTKNYPVSKEDLDLMIQAYQSGLSAPKAAAKYNRTAMVVIKELKKRGIKSRDMEECHRKYTLDESFFSKIDSEEKAYWLGFFAADGCVWDEGNQVKIGLKASDSPHLLKFKESIKSQAPIGKTRSHVVSGTTCYYTPFCVHSRRMRLDLSRYGIVQNKSLTLRLKLNFPKNLLRHFWRGMVDGDGCICLHNRKGKGARGKKFVGQWGVSLCGTKDTVYKFYQWTKEYVNSKARPSKSRNLWSFRIEGNRKAKKILNILYSGSKISLDRKKNLSEILTLKGG